MNETRPIDQAFAERSLAMPFAVVRHLEAMGVPRCTLAELCRDGLLAAGRVGLGESGLFEWNGPDARLLLAVLEDGAMIDVVALSSAQPERWHRLTGAAVMLGQDAFAQARAEAGWGVGPELRLHGNPFGWLRGGGAGVCVIDWGREAIGHLRGLGPDTTIICDDSGAAARLRDLLARGDVPRVTGQPERAAA